MVAAPMTAVARVSLKPGHVRPIYAGHPWVFQQAVGRVEGGPTAGGEVVVVDPQGRPLGRGLWSPKSAIAVRILSTDVDTKLDGAFFRQRLRRALELRRALDLPGGAAGRETTGFRAVHGEGDGLPGLIVDLFGDVACVQLNTIGMRLREGLVYDALLAEIGPRAIVDRTGEVAARMEGFELTPGVVRGDASIDEIAFRERGLEIAVPLALGQKTGFYVDQRPLRGRVEELARGRRVLDAYSFVGAFGLGAARGGASEVTCVDESAAAVTVGAELARRNGVAQRISYVRSDARKFLESASNHGGYDLVVCDPPKLATTQKSRDGALGAYQRLALSACRATKPRGFLVFCSCSGAVSTDDLVRALALGARQANLGAVVLERWSQGPDHPVPAAFPEGLYLKALVAQIVPLAGGG
jgi:23S rRNA (cytosine1962-C5)-methyltransferase